MPHIQRRAAFDIGSGTIKMLVADIDISTGKILHHLFIDRIPLKLRENLNSDQKFDANTQTLVIEALQTLKSRAAAFHPQAYSAIATESMRLALNGPELAKRIEEETGIPVFIVSQEEEGIIGFLTAVDAADIDANSALSWDSGAGSFQMTTKQADQFVIYRGRLGIVPMKCAILNIQGKNLDASTPNPISDSQFQEATAFIKNTVGELPQELKKKISNPNTVILGLGVNSLWGMQEKLDYTRTDVLKAISLRLNLNDEAISLLPSFNNRKTFTPDAVSNLILTQGVMEAFNIHEVRYVGASPSGNAAGILLSPQYWKY